MRTVAIVPFRAPVEDSDANDLAQMIAQDAAFALMVAGVIEPRVLVDFAEPADAAAQLGTDLALGASLQLEGEALQLSVQLVEPGGEVRAEWDEALTVGHGPQLGRLVARSVLLALGEDASAPAATLEAASAPELVLRLARARRRLSDEPDVGAEELVELAAELPAAARALLAAARDNADSDRTPIFYAALERLLEVRGEDPEVLLGAGDYRALHHEDEGARELFLAARDLATDQDTEAQALSRLAALAETAGRADEAIAHLRNAVRLTDDADVFARLGRLLMPRDALEGAKMLTRATVLSPRDAALHLELARVLREHSADPERQLSVATRAARLCEGTPLEAEAAAELENALRLTS